MDLRAFSGTLVLGVMVALPAGAYKPGPCAKDIKQFCKDVKPGKGRIIACLAENKDSLSPGCKASGQAVKSAVVSFALFCGADVKAHCSDVKPGGGRVLVCLGQNKDKLKPACKNYLGKAKEGVAKFNKDCEGDWAKLCKGVKPGWGRIYGCLAEKKAQLTPQCKVHFDGTAKTRGKK